MIKGSDSENGSRQCGEWDVSSVRRIFAAEQSGFTKRDAVRTVGCWSINGTETRRLRVEKRSGSSDNSSSCRGGSGPLRRAESLQFRDSGRETNTLTRREKGNVSAAASDVRRPVERRAEARGSEQVSASRICKRFPNSELKTCRHTLRLLHPSRISVRGRAIFGSGEQRPQLENRRTVQAEMALLITNDAQAAAGGSTAASDQFTGRTLAACQTAGGDSWPAQPGLFRVVRNEAVETTGPDTEIPDTVPYFVGKSEGKRWSISQLSTSMS